MPKVFDHVGNGSASLEALSTTILLIKSSHLRHYLSAILPVRGLGLCFHRSLVSYYRHLLSNCKKKFHHSHNFKNLDSKNGPRFLWFWKSGLKSILYSVFTRSW